MHNAETIQEMMYAMDKETSKLFKEDGVGDMESALTDRMASIMPYTSGLPALRNRDTKAFVFFTRPNLRMTMHNLVRDRKMARLLNGRESSVERYARVALDPTIGYGEQLRTAGGTKEERDDYGKMTSDFLGEDEPYTGIAIKSTILANDQPFIPILTNQIQSIGGFPNPTIDSYISESGMRKEQYGWSDGLPKIYSHFTLDVSFKSDMEQAISLMMDSWTTYQYMVKIGDAMPYMKYITKRMIDYTTGIYIIIIGDNGRNIKHVGKTIGFPTAMTSGDKFNIDFSTPLRDRVNENSYRFTCFGAEYDDPILPIEFNKTVARFVPELRDYLLNDTLSIKDKGYYTIPQTLYKRFNTVAKPFIDIKTNTLDWIVHEKHIKKAYKDSL